MLTNSSPIPLEAPCTMETPPSHFTASGEEEERIVADSAGRRQRENAIDACLANASGFILYGLHSLPFSLPEAHSRVDCRCLRQSWGVVKRTSSGRMKQMAQLHPRTVHEETPLV